MEGGVHRSEDRVSCTQGRRRTYGRIGGSRDSIGQGRSAKKPYKPSPHFRFVNGITSIYDGVPAQCWPGLFKRQLTGPELEALAAALGDIISCHRPSRYLDSLPGRFEIPGVPSSLSYGNLNLRNIGRRPNGSIVIFDWDSAKLAPLGTDFCLFQTHAAFPTAMRKFYNSCRAMNHTFPIFEAWLQQLLQIWNADDSVAR